jgi:hypothetical protein
VGQARKKYTQEYKDEAVELVVSSALFCSSRDHLHSLSSGQIRA